MSTGSKGRARGVSATERARRLETERKAAEMRLGHDRRMTTDPEYRGSVEGAQACVEDRRSGSVSFRNRMPEFSWALERVKRTMEKSGLEAVSDYIRGYVDGYMGEMSDTELDVSVSEIKLNRPEQPFDLIGEGE